MEIELYEGTKALDVVGEAGEASELPAASNSVGSASESASEIKQAPAIESPAPTASGSSAFMPSNIQSGFSSSSMDGNLSSYEQTQVFNQTHVLGDNGSMQIQMNNLNPIGESEPTPLGYEDKQDIWDRREEWEKNYRAYNDKARERGRIARLNEPKRTPEENIQFREEWDRNAPTRLEQMAKNRQEFGRTALIDKFGGSGWDDSLNGLMDEKDNFVYNNRIDTSSRYAENPSSRFQNLGTVGRDIPEIQNELGRTVRNGFQEASENVQYAGRVAGRNIQEAAEEGGIALRRTRRYVGNQMSDIQGYASARLGNLSDIESPVTKRRAILGLAFGGGAAMAYQKNKQT